MTTTDSPQTAAAFQRDLQRLYNLQIPFMTDEGGRTTATFCGGFTPQAFLIDEKGRLLLSQAYQESDEDFVAHILKKLGGEAYVGAKKAQKR